jgi:hypothetical protein
MPSNVSVLRCSFRCSGAKDHPRLESDRMKQRLPFAFYSGLLLMVIAPLAMAQEPIVTLSATSLSFGTLEAGTMSPAQVVTLTNTGDAVLTIA